MKRKIGTICVYCGSSPDVADIYKQAAHDTGIFLAQRNITLVYGGGSNGMMGIVSNTVPDQGGRAIGVMPAALLGKEVLNPRLTESHVVDGIREHKRMMEEKSDAFVVLPGGLGTLDEFFETLLFGILRLHNKPVVVVNIDDYWSPLLAMINTMIGTGFINPICRERFSVVGDVAGLAGVLE